MCEEKKKRVRPTLAQVKALEAEVERLSEENRLLRKSEEYSKMDAENARIEREKMVSELRDAELEIGYYHNRSFIGKLLDLFK